jgi:hypothetical protein
MEAENADQIPETFMKRFPFFLSNAALVSWLQYHMLILTFVLLAP